MAGPEIRESVTVAGRTGGRSGRGSPARSSSGCSVPGTRAGMAATRPERLGISSGSKVPARSRGTASGTGPTPVCTVLAIVPLREFPEWGPAGSCRP